MTENDLVTIASFGMTQEADIARGVLGAEDIPSFLLGAETANTLWINGIVLGGVKLQVAKRDAVRAAEVLEAVCSKEGLESRPPWNCPKCGNEVDKGFDICWSCGSPRDQDSTHTGTKLGNSLTIHSVEQTSSDELESGSDTASSHADDLAARAWRSALYGLAFTPLFLYSLYLVLKLASRGLGPRAVQQLYGTLALLFVMLIVLWFVFLTFVSSNSPSFSILD